jgi:hypothetical protein
MLGAWPDARSWRGLGWQLTLRLELLEEVVLQGDVLLLRLGHR